MSSRIYICDVPYEIDNQVITFKDDDKASYSAYATHHYGNPGKLFPSNPAKGLGRRIYRYRKRRQLGGNIERLSKEERLRRLQGVVHQFVIHLDCLRTASECVRRLHNERRRSSSLMVDGDWVIMHNTGLRAWPDKHRRRAEFRMAAQSMGCALENMMVAAQAEGLASYWLSAPLFCPDAVRDALDLPAEYEAQALVVFGYPQAGVTPRPPSRSAAPRGPTARRPARRRR